jgi:hypothetical protein
MVPAGVQSPHHCCQLCSGNRNPLPLPQKEMREKWMCRHVCTGGGAVNCRSGPSEWGLTRDSAPHMCPNPMPLQGEEGKQLYAQGCWPIPLGSPGREALPAISKTINGKGPDCVQSQLLLATHSNKLWHPPPCPKKGMRGKTSKHTYMHVGRWAVGLRVGPGWRELIVLGVG